MSVPISDVRYINNIYIDIEVFLHLPYHIEINIAFAYVR